MTVKRYWAAGVVVTGGALLAAAAGFPVARAADEAATAGAAAPAPASPKDQWHRHGRGPWHMYSKLGLTADQKTAIKSIMNAERPEMEALHQQMQANRLKLLQTNPGESNYASVVAEVAQSNAALMTQHATQNAAVQTKIYTTVLTAEQKAQLATLQQEWAAKIAARQAAAE
jgi:Spy/CpxP family protein refolding chaperone